MNKKLKKLAEPGAGLYLIILLVFTGVTFLIGEQIAAACEAGVILVLLVYSLIIRRKRRRELTAYIEDVTYQTDSAQKNTLSNFPLPMAAFKLDGTGLIWANEMFFSISGIKGNRVDAAITDTIPEFNSKWLTEGKTQYPGLLQVNGRKYRVHGNIVRPRDPSDSAASFMAISYWLDVTEYDDTRIEYEQSRPVVGVIVIDNLDELSKNQPERIKNDLRDAIEDRLWSWAGQYAAVIRRFERDRYILVMEQRNLEAAVSSKFKIIQDVHSVVSPSGVEASISIGLGTEGKTFAESIQYADMAAELALSRGGDQAVIRNHVTFEFFGGRGFEVEKRTKVKSRVMANTFAELVRDSSRVYAMGHRFADMDSMGAAVGVCCLARKMGVKSNIVIDLKAGNAAEPLIRLIRENDYYKDIFITPEEAMLQADSHTLLAVVDTSRPEKVEDENLLLSCTRVAVIDHHRTGSTFIGNAALSFIEPYASSACELMTEILQEVAELTDLSKTEAEALLAGITLDTKNFSIRTGDRTFDAAAYLRRAGASTIDVKKLMQTNMDDTVARCRIMQTATVYRDIAVATSQGGHSRVVAAQAADELLNVSGVGASVVIASDGQGGSYASARSIGDVNVQILMEKLGGGGNCNVAAAQFADLSVESAERELYSAIDDYMENQ
ncbi:MAG: DHH family phosphoesterase [Oscillospiraceae bacterium]|nr:DHH family phosphoesterase [Oscillospiraceae bacterium]